MWLTTTLVMCGLVQAAVAWNTAAADDTATGAELLPKDTLLFFTVPNVRDAREQFEKSLSGAVLNDQEFKPFFDDVHAKIGEKVQDELGVSIDELLSVPQGEITFALLERPARKLAPLFIMDYGDNKEIVEKLLRKLHDALDGDIAEHSTEEVDDVKVHVYKLKNDDSGDRIQSFLVTAFKSLVYYNDDKHVVFSTDVAALKEVLERRDGKSDDTLANNDVYKYIQDRCKDESGAPSAVWYTSPIGMIQAGLNVAQSLSPQVGMVGPFMGMFGVDKLKGFGGAGFGASGDFNSVSKTFLYVDQPTTGLVNLFQFPAVELAPPNWVSADAGVYMGANWNFTKAYQAVESLWDMFQGRGSLARLLDDFANSEQSLGIHPKKDVVDLLDGKFHVVQTFDAKEDSSGTQFLVAVEVKDAAKMKKTLSKVAKSEGSPVETREFNGETIYDIETDDGRTVSLAVAAGQLVITNDTSTLEGMLRTERQPPLADSPAYRRIAKHFPAKVSMVGFQRSDAQLKAFYEFARNADNDFLEWLQLDGIDMKKLPPFEVLQKYLRPSGSYTVPDKKGALTVGFQLREGDR
jgi:hypothetical protein